MQGRRDAMPDLVFNYFPISGRGEVAKLCAAVGGVEMKFNVITPGEHTGFGPSMTPPFPKTVPVLQHGDFTMYQSLAIETYICNLSEKYSKLTPQQKAIDAMFSALKEDLQQAIPKYIFGPDEVKAKVKEELTPILEAQYKLLEDRVPADGFVNGQEFPTMADFAVMTVVKGFTPYAWALFVTGYPIEEKNPKVFALANRVAEAPGVKEYIAGEVSTLKGNPFGLDGLA